MVKFTVSRSTRIDASRATSGRSGNVDRIMAGFAGRATRQVRQVARERINTQSGKYLRKIRSTVDQQSGRVRVTAGAPYSAILERGSRPHVIRPRKPGGVLRFRVNGRVVYAKKVNHPGTPAFHILRDGVKRTGRRLPG
jgi:hypothetical protein